MKLGGNYLGLDIRTKTGRLVTQTWAVRGMGTYDVGRETSTCMDLHTVGPYGRLRLVPGKYLVSVLTDAPSSLTFRAVPGLSRTMTLHPTRPAPRAESFWSQSRDVHPSSTTYFHSRKGGWGIVIADLRAPHALARNISTCVRAAEEACDDLDNNGGFTSTGGGESTTWEPMRPGYLRPGSYKAWFSTLAPDFTHESTFFTYFSTYS